MSGVEIRQRAAQKGRGAAGEGKRGGPPLYIGLAGALNRKPDFYNIKAQIKFGENCLETKIWMCSGQITLKK